MSSLMDIFDRFGAAQMPPVATEPADDASRSSLCQEFARALRDEPGWAACDVYWLTHYPDEWMVAPNRGADHGPLDAHLRATVDALRLRLGVPSAVVITLVFWH